MNLNITPYSVPGRHLLGGDCYPSQANFPGLKRCWHKGSGVAATAWTDLIAGNVLNAAAIAAGAATGGLTITTPSTITGTVPMPKADRFWLAMAVVAGSGALTFGVTTVADAQPGVAHRRAEATETLGNPTIAEFNPTGDNNHLSSYGSGNNSMTYTAVAAGVRAIAIDYNSQSMIRAAAIGDNAVEMAETAGGGVTGTLTGTPFAASMADLANPAIAIPNDAHLLVIFDWAARPANLEVGLAWMGATENLGLIYPGFRNL